MIDFVTLSRTPANVEALRVSIGTWLEGTSFTWNLIVLDGTRSDIFSGYNFGATQGDGQVLAFVHDDVEILANRLTVRKPMERLQETSTGFIGVAGSRVLLEHACWWQSHPESDCRGMAAHTDDGDFGLHWNVWPLSAGAGFFGRVAVLDGVLLMCRRKTWEQLSGFDAASYRGFHFYDIDITFRATLAGFVNYAVPIPLLHKSPGGLDDTWNMNRQIFIRKFGKFLPYRMP
jgi:hypothetical protein